MKSRRYSKIDIEYHQKNDHQQSRTTTVLSRTICLVIDGRSLEKSLFWIGHQRISKVECWFFNFWGCSTQINCQTAYCDSRERWREDEIYFILNELCYFDLRSDWLSRWESWYFRLEWWWIYQHWKQEFVYNDY